MIKIAFDPNTEKGRFEFESDCKNANDLIQQFAFMVGAAIHYLDGVLEKSKPDIEFPMVMLKEICDALEVIEDHADESEVSDHD